jgi:hypothetical protein
MTPDAMLSALLELAQSLNITVRTMPAGMDGQHGGGSLVKLRGREIIFLDGSAATTDQVAALAAALRNRPDLENRFLPPEVREEIDKA